MFIRVLQPSDAEQYQKLRLEGLMTNPEAFGSTYEREAAFSLETVAERIRPGEGKFVLGAFDEFGELKGTVTLVRETGAKTAHKANVYGMYVAQDSRGKGIGKALMRELIKIAREIAGLDQIKLSVVSGNEPAKYLYRSVGFEKYGTERNSLKWNGQSYDADLMVLHFMAEGRKRACESASELPKKEPYWIIKRADESDLQDAANLALKLWPDLSMEKLKAEIEGLIRSEKDAVFLARPEGKAIGFIHMSLRYDYVEGASTSPVGYVEGIYVEENARNRGIARALVAAGEQWAKSLGCGEIASDTPLDNCASQRFHEKIGFKEAGRIVAFIKKIE